MAEPMKDYEGTWVLTKRKYGIFTWYYWKYKDKRAHSENCIPELEIQDGFRKFSGFCKGMVSISRYSTFNFAFESICTKEEPITGKPIYFTPEDEDEVMREVVSYKLYRPLVNPSKKFGDNQPKLKLKIHPYRLVTL